MGSIRIAKWIVFKASNPRNVIVIFCSILLVPSCLLLHSTSAKTTMISRRQFTAIWLLLIVTLNIVLIHPDLVLAGKKRNQKREDLKKLIALCILGKTKKKYLIPLPLPIPMPIP